MYLHLVRTGTTLFARRALTSVFHRPKRCFKETAAESATGLYHEVVLLAAGMLRISKRRESSRFGANDVGLLIGEVEFSFTLQAYARTHTRHRYAPTDRKISISL